MHEHLMSSYIALLKTNGSSQMRFFLALGLGLLALASSAQVQSPRKTPSQPSASKEQVQKEAVAAPQVPRPPEPRGWEKEPEAFLGIRLGEPFTVAQCPTKNLGQLTRIDTLDYEAITKLEGVCFDPLDSGVKYAGASGPSSYKLANLPSLGIPYMVSVRVKASAVEKITIDLKQSNFAVLLDAFNHRYGPPTSVESGVVKNNAGAEFSARDVLWRGKKISIRMYERLNRVDESYVVVSDNALMEKEIEAIKTKRAAEAQKF